MLGSQVASDLQLADISGVVKTNLSWGASEFQTRLLNDISTEPKIIKRRQMPLFAFKIDSQLRNTVKTELQSLADKTDQIDDCLKPSNSLFSESVSQILWKPESRGAFLNKSQVVLQTLVNWKTIVLPGFAVLAPLLGLIIPFFVLRFFNPQTSIATYLTNVKGLLLRQVNIPTFLRAKGETDKLGFIFESLFIGFTLVMFISGLWNQVSSAIHLRNIWNELKSRGSAIQNALSIASSIAEKLRSCKRSYAFKYILLKFDSAISECKSLINAADVQTFGSLWNNGRCFNAIRGWIGHIDALVSIADLKNICIPNILPSVPLLLKSVTHPLVTGCIPNNYDTTESPHMILTGPNRGGKSTYVKSIGLALITSQSWGFAWASKMHTPVFAHIYTALESAGRLGYASTFEAEIEFAKDVLSLPTKDRIFVMMDEIFHSTNAVDGVAASKVFLEKLYKRVHTTSLLSTHYRELASTFSTTTTAIQMVAKGDDSALIYTYKVDKGISTKSSVMELLREHGLLDAPKLVIETPAEARG